MALPSPSFSHHHNHYQGNGHHHRGHEKEQFECNAVPAEQEGVHCHLLSGWPSTIIIIAIDTSIIIATKSIIKIIMLTMLIMISNNTNHHPIIINTVIIKMVHSCRVAPSASAPMSVAATLVIDSSIVERILALFTYIYELPLP